MSTKTQTTSPAPTMPTMPTSPKAAAPSTLTQEIQRLPLSRTTAGLAAGVRRLQEVYGEVMDALCDAYTETSAELLMEEHVMEAYRALEAGIFELMRLSIAESLSDFEMKEL